ncbi:hypothetical protein D9757_013892 [Collybiopsis confluens]|uniref:G domain-containing protein n=1 Tax=Collybiopsis confluens TaxID=2823264 RepID=A0A8H5CMS2_9AGAR|nr:hypothetical protein D9757_013892 [Collybiopsis confluens]
MAESLGKSHKFLAAFTPYPCAPAAISSSVKMNTTDPKSTALDNKNQQQRSGSLDDEGPKPGLDSQSKFEEDLDHTERNVILFGATGSGKTSIVNMLLPGPHNRAIVSNSAVNDMVFSAERYRIRIGDSNFSIFDLAGLSEGRSFSLAEAKVTFQNLLEDFSNHRMRIHLLVLCIRAPRITDVVANNYKLFYQTICKRQVPIVTVITGLENNEPSMEDWWPQNREIFGAYRMRFKGHACITAIKGKRLPDEDGFVYEKEYNDSANAVRNLISKSASLYDEGRALNLDQFGSLWSEIAFHLTEHISATIGKTIQVMSTAVGNRQRVVQKIEGGKLASDVWKSFLENPWRFLKDWHATKEFEKITKNIDNVPRGFESKDPTQWAGVELVIYGLPRDSIEAASIALRSRLQDMYTEKDKAPSRLEAESFNLVPGDGSFDILPGDAQNPVDFVSLVLKPGLWPEPRPDILEAVRRDLKARGDCGPVLWKTAAGPDKSRRVTYEFRGSKPMALDGQRMVAEYLEQKRFGLLSSSCDRLEGGFRRLNFDLASFEDFENVKRTSIPINNNHLPIDITHLNPQVPRQIRPVYGLEVAVAGCGGLLDPKKLLDDYFNEKYGQGTVLKSSMASSNGDASRDGYRDVYCVVFKNFETTIRVVQDPWQPSDGHLPPAPPVFLYLLNSYGVPSPVNSANVNSAHTSHGVPGVTDDTTGPNRAFRSMLKVQQKIIDAFRRPKSPEPSSMESDNIPSVQNEVSRLGRPSSAMGASNVGSKSETSPQVSRSISKSKRNVLTRKKNSMLS